MQLWTSTFLRFRDQTKMGDTNNAQQNFRNHDDQATSSQVSGGEHLAIGGSDTSSVGSSRKFYRSAEKR